MMLEAIFSIFIGFLSLIGLIEIFKIISSEIFKFKKNKDEIIVIPALGHNEEIEFLLRYAIFKAKWFDDIANKKVVCLDLGMDSETRQICKIFSKEHDFLYLSTPEEFLEILKTSVNWLNWFYSKTTWKMCDQSWLSHISRFSLFLNPLHTF